MQIMMWLACPAEHADLFEHVEFKPGARNFMTIGIIVLVHQLVKLNGGSYPQR